MKRSEIDASIDQALAFFDTMGFPLPAWARWGIAEWQQAGSAFDQVRALGLGWDVTDFGSGDLASIGRTIFTLRNGRIAPEQTHGYLGRDYAEKVMWLTPGQRSIIHCHRRKCEDIICRAGGQVAIQLWNATDDEGLGTDAVHAMIDGEERLIEAGATILLDPGQSICVPPMRFHRFWGAGSEQGTLSVEVSSICDDHTDNVFFGDGERFPTIEEDTPRRWILCGEYDTITANQVED